jgi:hypothetical protein
MKRCWRLILRFADDGLERPADQEDWMLSRLVRNGRHAADVSN